MAHEIHSYSSPFIVGHAALKKRFEDRPGLLEVPVTITEKIDGSQLSWMLDQEGVIHFRSRRVDIYPEAAGMFKKAVDILTDLAGTFHIGWIYRAEYLAKPKHNTIGYERVPKNHVILFDVETVPYSFLSDNDREIEAKRVGIECVPVYYTGMIKSVEQLKGFFEHKSILGGSIEGIVIKPTDYALFGRDKKVLMGKLVQEDFSEKNVKTWRMSNPTRTDVIDALIETYRTPQRWEKAVQHLREAGILENSPKDIGKLIKEVPQDILGECTNEIKDALFKHFWKRIARGVTSGLAEWYKQKLTEDSFDV